MSEKLRCWAARGSRLALAGAAVVVLYTAGGGGLETVREAPVRDLLPDGFRDVVVAEGFERPTALSFLPGGGVLVAEQAGRVWLVEGGAVRPRPVLDIRERVNSYKQRGLLGLAVDPAFERTGFLYVLYTYEDDRDRPAATKTGRLSRFVVESGSASPASEEVLVGTLVGASCGEFAPGADCIPQDWNTHAVGSIEFASDGTMFVSLGEAAAWEYVDRRSLRAQRLDSLAGKLLRVSPDGEGLPANPFWDGDPRSNASRIWALGLRNAFRFHLRPGTDVPYAADVGAALAEEVDVVRRGANLGWPCYEGRFRTPGYDQWPECRALYATPDAVTPPALVVRPGPTGGAIVGGPFSTGDVYPPEYDGVYFFADFVQGVLRYAELDARGTVVRGPLALGPVQTPVDFEIGPDGLLYYVSFAPGALHRLDYAQPGARGG